MNYRQLRKKEYVPGAEKMLISIFLFIILPFKILYEKAKKVVNKKNNKPKIL